VSQPSLPSELFGTDIHKSVFQQRTELKRDFDVIAPILSKNLKREVGFNEFLWAHAAYISRCFPASEAPDASSSVEEIENTCGVMIPVLDVANHSAEGADWRWEPHGGTAIMTRAVQAGQQLWSFYGHQSGILFAVTGFLDKL
jgi:hypothetical protein